MSEKLKLLYSQRDISLRVKELALQISKDYEGKELFLIGILKGAFIFLSDLVRALQIPVKIDFVRLQSYGSKTESSLEVKLTKDIESAIEGKEVLIVEDIVDTGITLRFLLQRLRERNPRSLKICALIDKEQRRKAEIDVDYVAFRLSGGFVVGYGLDFDEKYRYLPGIYEIERG